MNKKFNMRFFMFSGIVCTTLIPVFNLEYPFVLLILGISGILTSISLIYELGNKWINFLLIMFLPLFVIEWIGGMELNYRNLHLFLVIFVYQNVLVYLGLIIRPFTK